MSQLEQFTEAIIKGYTFKGDSFRLGSAMLNGEVITDAKIEVPLRTLNRHGLISGATGTGKTKTLQVLAEALSDASVPVLLMDIKGDLSGIAAPSPGHPKIDERAALLGIEYTPSKYPVELLSLSEEQGARLRATVTEFGPVLLSKVLGLNSTQESILAMLFKYCDDNGLALLDLKDLQKTLQWAANDGKDKLKDEYGSISTASVGTIMRKVIELQQQGADQIFGEASFEVDDLMRVSDDGRGIVNILRVTDIQDKPKLFSTFMLQLLSELYATMPEEGDLDRPKLVMFIDEAHLIFDDANEVLVDQLETIVKLIRSKGVGVFFCTQNPTDVPAAVLSQLGMKVQHALRAFTANDRKAIKQTAQNYPLSDFYDTEEIITQMGIGEALVTLLDEKGRPTPLAAVMLCPPRSRMDVLDDKEINDLVRQSKLVDKYNKVIDRESAYEILSEKMESAKEEAPERKVRKEKEEDSMIEKLGKNTVVKSVLRTAGNIIVRSLLGSLGVSTTTRRRKKNYF
ncbi:MAG: DUF853 family protein [Chitinophagales bacterium]|nr:DUF853 family protein [Chitinophagaceae bacterium]MCB9064341.1 DUF853 family protein [Chitinophagales bacterium]